MTYTAHTKYTLVDNEVAEASRKPTTWPIAVHYDIGTEAGWYSDEGPVETVTVRGFSVKIGDEWVPAFGPLHAMIEAAFVMDEQWLLDSAEDAAA